MRDSKTKTLFCAPGTFFVTKYFERFIFAKQTITKLLLPRKVIQNLQSQENKINLNHIESRASQSKKDHYEFIVSCNCNDQEVQPVIDDLKMKMGAEVIVLSRDPTKVSSSKDNKNDNLW